MEIRELPNGQIWNDEDKHKKSGAIFYVCNVINLINKY